MQLAPRAAFAWPILTCLPSPPSSPVDPCTGDAVFRTGPSLIRPGSNVSRSSRSECVPPGVPAESTCPNLGVYCPGHHRGQRPAQRRGPASRTESKRPARYGLASSAIDYRLQSNWDSGSSLPAVPPPASKTPSAVSAVLVGSGGHEVGGILGAGLSPMSRLMQPARRPRPSVNSSSASANLLVPDEHRMEIGRLLGIDYSLGPGSGIPLPGLLCRRCGQVQIHHYPEIGQLTPLQLAALFHEAYERLAPTYGYETRPETRTFDPETQNGRLMIAVCKEVLQELQKRHESGCQRCGSTRPFYHRVPLTNKNIGGILTICLDCGQVQGKRPHPGNQVKILENQHRRYRSRGFTQGLPFS